MHKELILKERLLHWTVSIGMITLLVVGLYMAENKAYNLYPLHKSFGFILFFIILWRVINRLRMGWPENISKGAAWEHKLAKLVHWLLIIGTILMPISGLMHTIGSGHGMSVFGLEIWASNYDAVTGEAIVLNSTVTKIGQGVHEFVGKGLIVVIGLHILGALKHHFLDKDQTLRRMLGK